MNGDRLKIAVFIDFDNIEIGVKSTLNRHFDIGAVLEAIKERGEVVTKIAYGDWKRAGEHSRSMTQHAIQMVQRNLTPGGDKNGADINLALDALEMAFTRNHINAFVIVGGDSDFIALVEKLKQYDKQVLIVGGRAFTSVILQKNCHEFIAYENLIAAPPQSSQKRPAERSRGGATSVDGGNLSKAVPLVQRALKVLNDREVSPQLGLLKSTLLQLDSTFSERDYGASTFRDFIEKMAAAGYVQLKQVDRSLLVEMKEPGAPPMEDMGTTEAAYSPVETQPEVKGQPSVPQVTGSSEEGLRIIQDAFQNPRFTPHWPMYLRNVKQFIKNATPAFDERKFGFPSFMDAVRAAQRAGILRLDRNRQGILRVYPGNLIQAPPPPPPAAREAVYVEEPASIEESVVVESEPIIEAAPVHEAMDSVDEAAEVDVAEEMDESEQPMAEEHGKPARKRKAASGNSARKKPTAAKPRTAAAGKRSRKKPASEETPA